MKKLLFDMKCFFIHVTRMLNRDETDRSFFFLLKFYFIIGTDFGLVFFCVRSEIN